jgi:hypothetical protein
MAVLVEIPPPPWIKVDSVLQYLALVPPYLDPSQIELWEWAEHWLKKA